MSKISIDIDYIKDGLTNIGYKISDCVVRENNGVNWQLKFSNSGAIVTIYDSNKIKNSVVNGKVDEDERNQLKLIVDSLKGKDLSINPLNKEIIKLIESRKEDFYYDFKKIPLENNADLLHDILCLSNNLENRDAYLIIGVANNYDVVGVDEEWESNNLYDFLKTKKFAGDNIPDVRVHDMYYKYLRIVVVEIKGSSNVPFYLSENYKGVFANQIYVRTGDTNTPKNKCASYKDIETLWRFHFGLE